jgi:iron-sulfur cluster assembly accessory protein
MITLTPQAIRELRLLLEAKRAAPASGLRLLVDRGGCAGMQYGMKIDDPAAGDEVIETDGVRVLVDPESLRFLRNVTVDYTDDLSDTGFKIVNPDASRSCGCGTSFEPADAAAPAAGE